MTKRAQFVFFFLLSLLACASTWFYVNRILKPAQVADAAAHNRPRGNLSDLYPRWLGARELLLHRRNPYSHEITTEIQTGYYGRPLDPARADDPKDQEGFAYPVYVVFLLAPTVTLPFSVVQIGFRWLLVGLTGLSVLLWFRVLGWKLSCSLRILCVVLVMGSLPVVQGIKLQQLSLLVAGLLAACAGCLVSGYLFSAGVLLALATVKPQLAWPLVLWLMLWAGREWPARRRFALGFGLAMVLLLCGAELLLPGWWRMFLAAIREYQQYTQSQSVLDFLFGPVLGKVLAAFAVLGCGLGVWPLRGEDATSSGFGKAFALVLALTVLIVPMYAPYNQVLLVPAILFLARDAAQSDSVSPAARLARLIGGLLLVWPWVATIGLSVASFWMSSGRRQSVWTLPFYSTFALPIFVFGVAWLDIWTRQRRGLPVSEAAE